LALKYNQVKLEKVLERERLLNKMVEERTSDLNKEKEKTEKLLLESEKSKNQLQAANELKSQLLSIAAHDLKNPLQVILGYEFYKEDMTLTDEEEEMLNSIFHAAKN
jgi:signal transduction histidine kinase